MLLDSLTRIGHNAQRLNEIIAVLGKYGLADWLGGLKYEWFQNRLVSSDGQRLGPLTQETRIRLALTELGTTFIKLGQVLSTRPDLVPPELARELSLLQTGTPPDPPEVIARTVAAELGKLPPELFAEFAPEPFASASIGQVHHARTRGGRRVVVKVQHDGITTRVERDLALMAGLAELLEKHVAEFRSYQPAATVRQFRRTLLRELDFNAERRSLEQFARNFANDTSVRFPEVVPELCSHRVLTMELLEGVPGTDRAALAATGADLSEFAMRAAAMYMNMIFRDGLYHADPHPGNYLLLPGTVVGMVDCGMIGRLDESTRELFEAIIMAILDRDTHELTDLVIRLGSAPASLDRDALRAEIGEFIADYGHQTLRDFDLSGALRQMVDIIRRFHIVLPAEVAMLLRTLIVLEGTSRQLSPSFSLVEVLRVYHEQHGGVRQLPGRLARRAHRFYRDWDRLLTATPGDLADIIRRLRAGSLKVRHDLTRLESTVHHLAVALLVAALFLGSALLYSHAVPPLLWGIPLLPAAGILAAGFLGARLLWTIRGAERHDPRD